MNLTLSQVAAAQGVIVNEFSNGDVGLQEYYELMVIGSAASPTGAVDLTGWILDDNNGDFGGGGGQGISAGAIRITGSCLANVLPGDLIVIYNAADPNPALPPDDPMDSTGDGVYVLPSDDGCLEACAAPPNSSDPSYSGSCSGAASWNSVAARNGGDAIQVRSSDPGSPFFHGFSFGANSPGPTFNVSPATGTDSTYYFSCGDFNSNLGSDGQPVYFRDNFAGIVGETPGAVNDPANEAFQALVRTGTLDYADLVSNCNSTTPISLRSFYAHKTASGVSVRWTTETETSNAGFFLAARVDGRWKRLDDVEVPSRVVHSLAPTTYELELFSVPSDQLALVEVDTRGRTRRFGPFEVGTRYGNAVETPPLEQPRNHSVARTQRSRTVRPQFVEPGQPLIELLVNQTGIYRVTYEALLAESIDLAGLDPASIALTSRDGRVPRRVHPSETPFGVGSYIEFVGTPVDTLYTATNVYRLSIDPDLAVSIATAKPSLGDPRDWYLEESRLDDNLEYSFAAPQGEPWYLERLLVGDSAQSFSYELILEDLRPEQGDGTLTVEMWGGTDWPEDPDHHVQIALNGKIVSDVVFDGIEDVTVEIHVPAFDLVEGVNQVQITMPADTGADFDLVNLEELSLSYPRRLSTRGGRLGFESSAENLRVETDSAALVAYRVATGPSRDEKSVLELMVRTRSAGTDSYHAEISNPTSQEAHVEVATPEGLLSPGYRTPAVSRLPSRADYLIVSPAAFISGMDPLVAARSAQGFEVSVVAVETIYGRYSHGVTDPQAIQRFLADSASQLGVEYVLLVGGDSYDYRDYLGLGSASFIPTMYVETGEIVRYAPSDAALVDFDSDGVPDLPVGRLPARNLEELESLIQKTLSFSRLKGRSALFAADHGEAAASYSSLSESLIDLLPDEWSVQRAYLDELSLEAARAQLLSSLDDGATLANYFGHSGPSVWTFDGLFSTADVEQLQNSHSPSIVAQWGCWNSYFVAPQGDTLAHRLLLAGEQGAAAVLGATTLTATQSERAFAPLLFNKLLEPGKTLGQAITEAKRELANAGHDSDLRDVLLGWTLLGDPALTLDGSLPEP